MNKGGLVTEVARRTGLSKTDVLSVIDNSMDVIRERVVKGERVALVGFGTFEKRRRNKRIARNPRKPEMTVTVPARDVPWFTAGKQFKDLVDKKRGTTKKKVPAKKKK